MKIKYYNITSPHPVIKLDASFTNTVPQFLNYTLNTPLTMGDNILVSTTIVNVN